MHLNFLTFVAFLCGWVWLYTYPGALLKVRGQLVGVCSLLPPGESQRSNPDRRACQQAPAATEPFLQVQVLVLFVRSLHEQS